MLSRLLPGPNAASVTQREVKGAYGKVGNENEVETGNGNWKWETKMGTKNAPITGAMFLHRMLSHYS